jgi:NADH dehydrogenase
VTSPRRVVVFGGTGFLGRRIAHHLLDHGHAVRIASRHPERAASMFGARVETTSADVSDERSVAAALDGMDAAVNAVSLYVESAGRTFHAVHVEAARRVARLARAAGVERFVHISGIGADAHSASPYIRSRGEGEEAVRAAFPSAVIVRPAVMFGEDGAFLNGLVSLLRRAPVFPMFGRGDTRLQPAYVEDVAEAVARIMQAAAPAPVYELGGPRVMRYAELLRTVAAEIGVTPRLVPVPFALWRLGASAAEWLPYPPITRNQVELMRFDNVVAQGSPGFEA